MLTNATILRIDRPTAPNGAGQIRYVIGLPVACRCFLGDITQGLKYSLGDKVKDATCVAHVPMAAADAVFGSAAAGELGGGSSTGPHARQRLVVRPDGPWGSSDVVAVVLHVGRHVKASLSHYRVYLQEGQ